MQFLRGSNFFTLILYAFTPLTLVAFNILLSYLSKKEIENMHSLLSNAIYDNCDLITPTLLTFF